MLEVDFFFSRTFFLAMNPTLVPTPPTGNARLSGRPHSAHHSRLALSSAAAACLATRHRPGPKRLPRGWRRRLPGSPACSKCPAQSCRQHAGPRRPECSTSDAPPLRSRCAQGSRLSAAPQPNKLLHELLGLIAPTAADLTSHGRALGSASAELWIACGLRRLATAIAAPSRAARVAWVVRRSVPGCREPLQHPYWSCPPADSVMLAGPNPICGP